MPDTILATLPDDAEPAATAFGFEKTHPELFSGHPIAQAAVLFPYETRNHTIFGSLFNGVSRDFTDTIALLFSNGISPIVEMEIPSTTAKCPLLILPSALRLTDKERDALHAFIQDGGVVLATGPFALGPKWEANITAPDNFFTSDAWMKTPFPPFPERLNGKPCRRESSGINSSRGFEAFADEMLAKVRQYAHPARQYHFCKAS